MSAEATAPIREVEIWAATRTLAMHFYGRCAQCPPEGGDATCRMEVWAKAIRAQAERQGMTVPPIPREHPTWEVVPARSA